MVTAYRCHLKPAPLERRVGIAFPDFGPQIGHRPLAIHASGLILFRECFGELFAEGVNDLKARRSVQAVGYRYEKACVE